MTGRKCEACGGDLKDSIINFGEPLNANILNRAYAEGEKCDLMLSLGSSLRVTPACNIPAETGLNPNQKHVIVNLQKTPCDDEAEFIIHGFIDDVMERLMAKLGLQIPLFQLDRWVKVAIEESKAGETLHVTGIDHSGGPFDLFKSI